MSQAMEGILERLAKNEVFEREREPLANFYATMTQKISAIDNLAGKQEIMRTLYDRFFTKAFSAMQDRLGIVFTPVEVVDYILHSADAALRRHLGRSLSDRGVSLIEPFLGTGTFVARLLQSGLIRPEDLEHKYANEIFANEIVLLSYYIASINIEQVYREIRKEQGYDDEYQEFKGIALTDTFRLGDFVEQAGHFQANLERAKRQQESAIRVVIMNPPYSAGQNSANDNNQNLKYKELDKRIEETYTKRSTATNKNSLYDSYYRSLRWATDRIGEEGVIAFVSNSSFIDGNTADGVRLTWQNEFSDIYVYNLRGGKRGKLGDGAGREGGNVFPIMTGVAITVLVKTAKHQGEARIHYVETADGMMRQEKLDQLKTEVSIEGTQFEELEPNGHGDWINHRDEKYLEYQLLGDKTTKGKANTTALFILYSAGLQTNRDSWCYNFSSVEVQRNVSRMIDEFNRQVSEGRVKATADSNSTAISWSRRLYQNLERKINHSFNAGAVVGSIYRPFCKQSVYFDRSMNDVVYQLPQIFPTPAHGNIGISIPDGPSAQYFMPIIYSNIPALTPNGGNQFFPLYTWQKDEALEDGMLDLYGSVAGGAAPLSKPWSLTSIGQ